MTKYEMVEKYNYYVRKRECYKAKIQANTLLKQTVIWEYQKMITDMNAISDFSEYAEIFKELYSQNYTMFSDEKVMHIEEIFDSIDTHLKDISQSCQDMINYYDAEIKKVEVQENK